MNENIIGILIIYFFMSAMVGGVVVPIYYERWFYDSYETPSVPEIMFLVALGIILGGLILPITMVKGFIDIIRHLIERFEKDED